MTQENNLRRCSTCKFEKPLIEFSADSFNKSGFRCYCKCCAKVRKLIYLEKNKISEGLPVNLNQAKFNSIFNGLASVAKKTYDLVPIKNAWDANQIHQEGIRQGSVSDLRTTTGCLNTLVSSGLVSEPTRGTFIRIEVKQKTQAQIASEEAKPKESKTPLEVLIDLAITAKSIGAMVSELSKNIDDAALQIQIQLDSESEDTQKLKQLQQILKSLG